MTVRVVNVKNVQTYREFLSLFEPNWRHMPGSKIFLAPLTPYFSDYKLWHWLYPTFHLLWVYSYSWTWLEKNINYVNWFHFKFIISHLEWAHGATWKSFHISLIHSHSPFSQITVSYSLLSHQTSNTSSLSSLSAGARTKFEQSKRLSTKYRYQVNSPTCTCGYTVYLPLYCFE